MIRPALTLVLLIVLGPNPAASGQRLSPRDSAALLDSLSELTRVFVERWREAWIESEIWRVGEGQLMPRREWPRMINLHCHGDKSMGVPWPGPTPDFSKKSPNLMSSSAWARSYCPSWRLAEVPPRNDEAHFMDASLGPPMALTVRSARGSLLARLDAAAKLLPGDSWIAGQRVRFLIDAGQLDRALAVAKSCRAMTAWCQSLVAYTHYRRGEVQTADAEFLAAAAAHFGVARCEWMDARHLLEPDDRAAYAAKPCAEREDLARRALWLADPLLSTPWNERRVEHFARRVLIALHSAVYLDERYDWRPRAGGDVVREMLLRYGWPSFAGWGGFHEDGAHSGWLKKMRMTPSPPYSTAEYLGHRLHFVPSWRAIENPFESHPGDWTLGAPPDIKPLDWWPVEHVSSSRHFIQLQDRQVAMFPRQSNVLIGAAADIVEYERAQLGGGGVQAVLALSVAPDRVVTVAERSLGVEPRAVVRGTIDTLPAILGLEVLGPVDTLPVAWLRQGIRPPAPLSALPRATIAVSEPMLIDAPWNPSETLDGNAAISRMLGTTRLRGVTKIGVYWETYGAAPQDSIEVAIRLEHREQIGRLRSLAVALRLTDKPDNSVKLRWREPQAASGVADGIDVPIRGRWASLDITRLPRGDYWLEVLVEKAGVPAASSRRPFVIE